MQSGGGCKKTMVMITNQNGFETQPNQKGSLVVNCPLLTTAAAAPRWQRRRPGTGGKLVVVAVKGGDGGGNSCWSLPPRDKSVREALLPTSTNSSWPLDQWTRTLWRPYEKKNTLEHWILEHWNIWHSISINYHLVTSIVLILFKQIRVALLPFFASMDWMKIWESRTVVYNSTASI